MIPTLEVGLFNNYSLYIFLHSLLASITSSFTLLPLESQLNWFRSLAIPVHLSHLAVSGYEAKTCWRWGQHNHHHLVHDLLIIRQPCSTLEHHRGRHSTEVAFALLTRKLWVRFSAFSRTFSEEFFWWIISEEIHSWCCRDESTALLRVWKAWICWSSHVVIVSGKLVQQKNTRAPSMTFNSK